MLVYANYLGCQGPGAEDAMFRAVGAWLKDQLGYGLRPEQVRKSGTFDGKRGESTSWLQIRSTAESDPRLYSWILKHTDDRVRGRQWIVELGARIVSESVEFSCVLRTDDQSTLVEEPVIASRPRVIRYLVRNLQSAKNTSVSPWVPGIQLKSVGEDRDSYKSLLAEIERRDRTYPIVLLSPTRDGDYLVDASRLQRDLIGLAQVVRASPEYNSYDMEEVLGRQWSAWSGAINILHIPFKNGFVRGRLFLSEEIEGWGPEQRDRVSKVLAWVTNNTNVPRLRQRIRSEGVVQLELTRRLQAARTKSTEMDVEELRQELESASQLAAEQAEWIEALEDDNSQLLSNSRELQADLEESKSKLAKAGFNIQALKDRLEQSGVGRTSELDAEMLLQLACRSDQPTPLDCLEAIESVYGDRCVVLESAKEAARNCQNFTYGRQLLDLLRRLATDYRSKLMEGGDSVARSVFGKNEFAARESDTVVNNPEMRRLRTFDYNGSPTEMFRHLKIGVADDSSKTIRVHFHWDSNAGKIVIGYCGGHLPVASH